MTFNVDILQLNNELFFGTTRSDWLKNQMKTEKDFTTLAKIKNKKEVNLIKSEDFYKYMRVK